MSLPLTDEEPEGMSLPPDAVKDREQEAAVMVQYVYVVHIASVVTGKMLTLKLSK